MKILVLCSPRFSNGNAEERFWPVDRQIISEIKKLGHETTALFFDKEKNLDVSGYELAFNLCDGFEDIKEEALVPEFLSSQKVPFTGCNAETINDANNKLQLKRALLAKGIPTPEFQLFEKEEEEIKISLSRPVIVKPIIGHASTGIEEQSVVGEENALKKQVAALIAEQNCPALVERYIPGREFCVPMVGNEEPANLPMLEINYMSYDEKAPKILTYKAKWSKNSNVYKNTDSIVARDVEESLRKKIEETAKKAFKAIGCTGYATVDVRVDEKNNVYVIDVNPNSYIAGESDFVKAAAVLGLSHGQLLEKFIELALERRKEAVAVLV